MGMAHHFLGLGYLEIEGLTVSHVVKLFRVNQMSFEAEPEKKSDGLTMSEVGALMSTGGLKSHGRR